MQHFVFKPVKKSSFQLLGGSKAAHRVQAVLCQNSFHNLVPRVTPFFFSNSCWFATYYTNTQQSGEIYLNLLRKRGATIHRWMHFMEVIQKLCSLCSLKATDGCYGWDYCIWLSTATTKWHTSTDPKKTGASQFLLSFESALDGEWDFWCSTCQLKTQLQWSCYKTGEYDVFILKRYALITSMTVCHTLEWLQA